MGYVSLLLNAPYKIDSMMGMRWMMMDFCFYYVCDVFLLLHWATQTKSIFSKGILKCT
jgi:hypothetical protein